MHVLVLLPEDSYATVTNDLLFRFGTDRVPDVDFINDFINGCAFVEIRYR